MPKMDRSQRNFGNVDRRIGLWDAIEETIEWKSKWFNLLNRWYWFLYFECLLFTLMRNKWYNLNFSNGHK
jgi:hypothetical protein